MVISSELKVSPFPRNIIGVSQPLFPAPRCAIRKAEEKKAGQSGRISNVCRTSAARTRDGIWFRTANPLPSSCARAIHQRSSKEWKLIIARCALLLLRNRSFALVSLLAGIFSHRRFTPLRCLTLIGTFISFPPSLAFNTQEEKGKTINRNALSLFHKDR